MAYNMQTLQSTTKEKMFIYYSYKHHTLTAVSPQL